MEQKLHDSVAEPTGICQDCKHHENNPSRCERLGMYVPRKAEQPCCEPK